ncbi:aminotransferase class I/II-fold pyridoxal phosphate-dependent enzyme [Bradyrhizobium sp. RT5a]|uniref:aminotransferase class I/II-fold pyridoxal phosphate-dependent enzyme n=1 Tax=unclassified Bradyrhizobium TaxID=2631580 RepID=UPI00339A4C2A
MMMVGDTDFGSPASSVAAAHESLAGRRTHYSPSGGGRPMREAIARRHAKKSSQMIGADQVVVTIGAQNALLTAALCLIEPGEQVLVPNRCRSPIPAPLPLPAARASASVRVTAAIGPCTRAIFLATPNNDRRGLCVCRVVLWLGRGPTLRQATPV